MVKNVQARRRPLSVAFLDIRNAFGSVRHDCIDEVLRHFDAPTDLIECIEDIYTRNTCTVRCGAGETGSIPVGRGVRQGCPLSGLLFNLVIEVLLRGFRDCTDVGYRLPSKDDVLVRSLAYADDICLVTSDREQMNKLLSLTHIFSLWAGVQFNPKKCGTLSFGKATGGRRPRDMTPFSLGGEDLHVVSEGDTYKYLGARTGYDSPITISEPFRSNLEQKISLLFRSYLTPGQKLLALKSVILPSAYFQLRVRHFRQYELKALDRLVGRCLRIAWRLPKRSCKAFLHASQKCGGLGVPNLCRESDILTVTHAYKMLTSPDGRVAAIAFGQLERYASLKWGTAAVSVSDLVGYLNGELPPSGSGKRIPQTGGCMWTRLGQCSRRINIRWIALDTGGLGIATGQSEILPVLRKKLVPTLHHESELWWRGQWESKADQGKTVSAHCLSEYSNTWTRRPDLLSHEARQFAFKARLNVLPTRKVCALYSGGPNSSIMCRRCGAAEETLPHILNHCESVMDVITSRHDSIGREITGHMPNQWRSGLSLDRSVRQHVEAGGANLRPDIVLHRPDGVCVVSDVTCPFEFGAESLERAAERKRTKYDELCVNLADRTRKQVLALPYVVGSLGSYPPSNSRALVALGVPLNAVPEVARKTVTLAIEGSLRVWRQWNAGLRRDEATS